MTVTLAGSGGFIWLCLPHPFYTSPFSTPVTSPFSNPLSPPNPCYLSFLQPSIPPTPVTSPFSIPSLPPNPFLPLLSPTLSPSHPFYISFLQPSLPPKTPPPLSPNSLLLFSNPLSLPTPPTSPFSNPLSLPTPPTSPLSNLSPSQPL
ncbi:hypothetical protein Pcinc_034830 [Petrolisthes cinctipes]|uniref:Uncharacterized protein n=1 Tax=Petrolisthes cinctipes TaxID=88211 RepID=A0AAE1BZJ2_PETCI|nr:hypothetical protein Pcinc_034830 [Petrolisthes cinctipes]